MNREPDLSRPRWRRENNLQHFSIQMMGSAWTRSGICLSMSTAGAAAGMAALMLAAQVSAAQSVFPATVVGAAAAQQAVVVTAQAAGTVDHEAIVTLGQPGLDFTLPAVPVSTCTGVTLTVGGVTPSCSQSVTFTPTTPGVRIGAVELFDAGGDLLGETLVSGSGVGGLAVLVPGNTLPFAGNGNHLDPVQDGIPALTAELDSPTSVAIDGAGNVYIADSEHNRIRMVSEATGLISTFAGTGTASYTGDNAAATAATLNTPSGVALDGAGNVYIADTGNNAIRRVDAVTHVITTVAGNGSGLPGFGGDGTLAISGTVLLDGPQGISVDVAGDLYVADTNNQVVREVSVATGDINTVAGEYFGPFGNGVGGYNGDGVAATAATLNLPYAVAFDAASDVLIADAGNNRIREINATTLKISTVAGDGTPGFSGDNAAATLAELNAPTGIALDPAGNLYIGDSQNNRVRKVNAASGDINTLAVSGGEYLLDTDSIANTIAVKGPQGLLVDGEGDVYFANTLSMQVWEIESNVAALDFTATPIRQGSVSAPQFQTVENDGNDVASPLAFTSITAGANAEVDTTIAAGACAITSPLAVDSECTIGVEFAPAATPVLTVNTTEAGTVDAAYTTAPAVTGPNSPLAITAVGVAEALNSTTTVVTATPDPSLFGQNVIFTVQVTTGTGTGALNGTVSITDTFGGTTTTLANGLTLNATGAATLQTALLAVGGHSIVANYSGDAGHGASSSTDNGVSPWSQVVEEQTTIALTSSANPSQVGQSVTFTATVTAPDGGGVLPDGTLSFMDGTTTLADVPLAGGVATFTTAALVAGAHPITAIYSGDETKEILGETSAVLTQDVQAAATLVVTTSGSPSNYGNPVTFTATIASGATTAASGVVNFFDAGVKIGTGTLSGGNPDIAQFTTAALTVGTHPITATYAGDNFNTAAASVAINQVVSLTVTADTVTAAPNPGVQGTAETLTDTVTITQGAGTATGVVTFTSGTTVLGTANLTAAGTATISPVLAPGNYSIVATYAGDTDDAGSQSAPVALTVENSSATTVTSTPDPSLFGQSVTFTVQVTSGAGGAIPSGNVTIFDTFGGVKNMLAAGLVLNATGSATFATTTLAVGAHSISVTYSGDASHAASTSTDNGAQPLSQIVEEQTAVTLTSSVNPSLVGQSVTFTATVAALNGGGILPDGTVTFMDGATTLFTGPLAGGVITYTTATLANGLHPITAVYSGDATKEILGETSAVLNQIVQAPATIVVTTSGSPSYFGAPVTFTATIASSATIPAGGVVNFFDAGAKIGTGTLSGGTPDIAQFTTSALDVGTHSITATYAGDNSNTAAASAPITQVVTQTQTATTVAAVPSPGIAGLAETITATVTITHGTGTPTGLVTFTSGAIVLGTANLSAAGTATINPVLAPGNYSIVATYAGDTNDGSSVSAPFALTVAQATTVTALTVVPNPSSWLQSVAFTATVTGNGAIPTGMVQFFAGGVLIGAGTLNLNGVATLNYASLAIGTYAITATYAGDANDAASTSLPVSLTVGKIPTTTDLGSSTTSGANSQTILVATVVGNVGPVPTGTVTFTNALTTLGTATLDSTGVASLPLNLAAGTYVIEAVYSGDATHLGSTSLPITVTTNPVGFTLTVTPTTVSLKTSQHAQLGLIVTSEGGFTDTVALGCLGLPAGVNCHFSSPTVMLAANGTSAAQLTIDTNSPLSGGSTAMNRRVGSGGAMLAGVLFPFSILFGWIFRRQRKRLASAFTVLLLIALSAVALVTTGCSGISTTSAAPGTYTIQVVASGITTGVVETQNVSLTITK
jgi:large repetitive protein